MERQCILVADNHAGFVGQVRQYLERNGFLTFGAETPKAAREALRTHRVDLAILDLRMVNDEDPDDWSGIEIARDIAPMVPKIVLTAYPCVRAVREALSPALRDVPAAVDFLSKKQGLPMLLEAVRVALDPGASESRKRLLAV